MRFRCLPTSVNLRSRELRACSESIALLSRGATGDPTLGSSCAPCAEALPSSAWSCVGRAGLLLVLDPCVCWLMLRARGLSVSLGIVIGDLVVGSSHCEFAGELYLSLCWLAAACRVQWPRASRDVFIWWHAGCTGAIFYIKRLRLRRSSPHSRGWLDMFPKRRPVGYCRLRTGSRSAQRPACA